MPQRNRRHALQHGELALAHDRLALRIDDAREVTEADGPVLQHHEARPRDEVEEHDDTRLPALHVGRQNRVLCRLPFSCNALRERAGPAVQVGEVENLLADLLPERLDVVHARIGILGEHRRRERRVGHLVHRDVANSDAEILGDPSGRTHRLAAVDVLHGDVEPLAPSDESGLDLHESAEAVHEDEVDVVRAGDPRVWHTVGLAPVVVPRDLDVERRHFGVRDIGDHLLPEVAVEDRDAFGRLDLELQLHRAGFAVTALHLGPRVGAAVEHLADAELAHVDEHRAERAFPLDAMLDPVVPPRRLLDGVGSLVAGVDPRLLDGSRQCRLLDAIESVGDILHICSLPNLVHLL